MPPLKDYTFRHNQSLISITILASTLNEAIGLLENTVKNINNFKRQ